MSGLAPGAAAMVDRIVNPPVRDIVSHSDRVAMELRRGRIPRTRERQAPSLVQRRSAEIRHPRAARSRAPAPRKYPPSKIGRL